MKKKNLDGVVLVAEQKQRVCAALDWLGEGVFLTSSAIHGIVQALWHRMMAWMKPRTCPLSAKPC